MKPRDVLFVHNNFPSQFGFLADALKARGDRVAVLGSATARSDSFPVQRWSIGRGTGKDVFPLAVRAEADLLRARAAVDAALTFKRQGFDPALIVGHPGWGETLLLPEVFPEARQVLHAEFYYHATGADVGFDPEFGEPDQDERFRVHAKNLGLALAYAQADRIVSPTPFQASTLPPLLRAGATVIHEGIDTDAIRPDPAASVTLPDGRVLDRSTPVVTFINRNFEPLRGFHVFMRALPRLLERNPDVEVVLIGAEGKGYGLAEAGGWRARMERELEGRLDPSRLHFLGRVPHPVMLSALSISRAHVYYTYPFVLSWSLLEAMASECLIIGSDTPPLRDAVTPGHNGILLDFFDTDALADALLEACAHPDRFVALRKAARRTAVERYDRRRVCLPAWMRLLASVRKQGARRPTHG